MVHPGFVKQVVQKAVPQRQRRIPAVGTFWQFEQSGIAEHEEHNPFAWAHVT